MYTKLVGAGIDACAGTKGSADTPDLLQQAGLDFEIIHRYNNDIRDDVPQLQKYYTQLANSVKQMVKQNDLPIIIGGDHSCAIGSWSGIANALSESNQSLGLIWFDAHMDSHTPETSPSGNIHGMPIATLLGYGYPELTSILNSNPKILPENIILIGIRSYEQGEHDLLKRLGVKVHYIEEVKQIGLNKIMHDAWLYLSQRVSKIGLSIDLDGFDPNFVPGVGTPVDDGLNFHQFLEILNHFDFANKLVGVEITEGNFSLDNSDNTRDCIIKIVDVIKSKHPA